MADSIAELRLDMEELSRLLESATRQRVQDAISIELRRLQTKIVQQQEHAASQTASEVAPTPKATKSNASRYTEDLFNYGWDQSEKFMKIYVTLEGVHNIPTANVKCDFTSRSFRLLVEDLNEKNYKLQVGSLYSDIVPEGSSFKIKTDKVLVMLKKANTGKTWAYVTEREKKSKEASVAKPESKTDDPSAGLMDLLKKMYDDGDEETKRTIGKAWTESREKQGAI